MKSSKSPSVTMSDSKSRGFGLPHPSLIHFLWGFWFNLLRYHNNWDLSFFFAETWSGDQSFAFSGGLVRVFLIFKKNFIFECFLLIVSGPESRGACHYHPQRWDALVQLCSLLRLGTVDMTAFSDLFIQNMYNEVFLISIHHLVSFRVLWKFLLWTFFQNRQ